MSTITILGAGVMGSAMCLPARDRGNTVRLVGTHLDREIIDSVKASGRHPKLNVKLPGGVCAFHHEEFAAALGSDTDLIVLGVSSAGIPWAIDRLCESLKAAVPVVMITKGMHPEEGKLTALPDRVAAEVKRRAGLALPVAAIGGPCIAGELAVRRQTGTVITSHDMGLAERLCAMLETDYYHPRVSPDVIGVEICAAFKNFFAIGVGWAAGHLEKMAPTENRAFNHNAAAIIFDQAIRELMLLVKAHGGGEQSVWGMPGAGDLYVTCQAGRNSRLGNNLGRGLTYSETKRGPMKGDTIEGAELGLAVAAALRAMMAAGTLDARALPLTNALLDALTRDAALDIPWPAFHRHA
ncbi:NAD(P)H-dependent glycerol-3-phosphate dehydrogenase [Aestuariivirga sp.]|uniref:NAD(P)H-dependent glycerol-3-phosphate dehydrogenase n=1 Tax=Aestuariivirga sp. TaxID=2650926 RepID=UPI00391AF6D8